RGPIAEKFAEAGVLLGDRADESRVGAHRSDLRPVAHDTGVLREVVPVLVGLEHELARVEAEEGFLESLPLRLDHAPGKARREYAPRHLGENAIVLELCERF